MKNEYIQGVVILQNVIAQSDKELKEKQTLQLDLISHAHKGMLLLRQRMNIFCRRFTICLAYSRLNFDSSELYVYTYL
jgi:hypothetical protein